MKNIDKLSKKAVERLKKQQEANALREQLTLGPDLLIQSKGSDQALDKINEKIELISGKIIDLRELREYIDSKINAHVVRFVQDYYIEIFRLNGWTIPEGGIISYKPNIVGKFTIDIIYGRFPKEVLPALEGNNRYNEIGVHLYKHFQFLTPKGIELLDKFIGESVIIMKNCKYWNEFVTEHAKKYGYPFQTSLFN